MCTCGSKRLMSISAKCGDLCCINLYEEGEKFGDVPDDLNIGGGDYIRFTVCMDCGKIQGKWPVRTNMLGYGSHCAPIGSSS